MGQNLSFSRLSDLPSVSLSIQKIVERAVTEEDKTGRLVALVQYWLITSRDVRELCAVQDFLRVWIEET